MNISRRNLASQKSWKVRETLGIQSLSSISASLVYIVHTKQKRVFYFLNNFYYTSSLKKSTKQTLKSHFYVKNILIFHSKYNRKGKRMNAWTKKKLCKAWSNNNLRATHNKIDEKQMSISQKDKENTCCDTVFWSVKNSLVFVVALILYIW